MGIVEAQLVQPRRCGGGGGGQGVEGGGGAYSPLPVVDHPAEGLGVMGGGGRGIPTPPCSWSPSWGVGSVREGWGVGGGRGRGILTPPYSWSPSWAAPAGLPPSSPCPTWSSRTVSSPRPLPVWSGSHHLEAADVGRHAPKVIYYYSIWVTFTKARVSLFYDICLRTLRVVGIIKNIIDGRRGDLSIS